MVVSPSSLVTEPLAACERRSPSLRLRVNINVNSIITEPSAACDRHRIPPSSPSLRLKWPSSSNPSIISKPSAACDRRRIPRPHEPSAACDRHRLHKSTSPSLRLRVNVNSIVIESLDLTSLRLRVIVIVFSSRPHEPSATCDRHRLLKWPSSSNPSTSRAFGCVWTLPSLWLKWPSSSNPSTSRAFGYV